MQLDVKMFALICLLIASTHYSIASTDIPPHIVFILSDDLGWNDVSYHGWKESPTPNIDSIALDGVVLNNYHVLPACTPSRSALLTGLYPIRTGLQTKTIMSSTPFGLPLKERILPEYFKSLNYITHGIGKWNMGHFKNEYLPMNRGFDSFFGYWNAAEDYFSHVCVEKGTNYSGYDLHDNFETAWNYSGVYGTDVFTSRAKDVILNHDISKPMFLYLAHQAPHGGNLHEPLQIETKYFNPLSAIEDENRRKNAAMVSALDQSVGEIFQALEQSGMLDNTLLVFTNDNGANIDNNEGTMGSNFPLKGGKGNLWEGGVRTAGFAWSPVLRESSRVLNGKIHITDWLPTLLSAAGGSMSSDQLSELDGMDQWSCLMDDSACSREEMLLNINPSSEGYLWKNFKLVKGSYDRGMIDLWSDQSGNTIQDIIPKYPRSLLRKYKNTYKKLLKKSKAAKILHQKYGKDPRSAMSCRIPGCDTLPTVSSCGTSPGKAFPPASGDSCRPNEAPCLFDLDEDVCEYHNIADQHPEIVSQLEEKINSYRPFVQPSAYQDSDPAANPELHDGVWNPWM